MKVLSLALSLILIASSLPLPSTFAEEAKPTLYVSIVSHNEEPNSTNHPDFTKDYESYEAYRTGAVNFAEMVYENGAKYNFQSDWNFLLAEQSHWEDFENTNGKNLLRWLEEDLDFAVDPHAHESTYSIADVAYLMEGLGVTPSNIVGGFIAAPSSESRVDDFQKEISGWKYNTSWEADALWGAATGLHSDDSDLHISGIWRAKNNENFTTHDSDSKPVIGSYTSDWDGLSELLEKRENGDLDPDEMYTVTIMNNQEDFSEQSYLDNFETELKKYADETAEGAIKWVTLEEALQIWEEEFNENPNIYSYEQGDLTTDDSESSSQNTSSAETPFTDINGHWAEEVITSLYQMGVIQGKSTTLFAPNEAMTRAELLKVALLAAGFQVPSTQKTSAFSDVSNGDWFMPYVAYAYEAGYIEGYSNGSFGPNNSINRAEALAILLRVAEEDVDVLGDSEQDDWFSDTKKEDWFFTYVMFALNTGVVEGYPDGSFGPAKNVSRAEFCTMVGRQFTNTLCRMNKTLQASFLSAVVLASCQSTPASTQEKTLTEHNVLFTLNTQEFIFSEESVETVNRVIDIHEEYDVPVDIYLDGVILQTYLEEAPELIERLKESSVVSVSYHARPPMPYYNSYEWMDFESMTDTEIEAVIEEYGAHAIDPATGETTDEKGGFTYFEEVFGYPPPAAATPTNGTTGPFVKSYFADNGASFLVENDRDYSWGATKDGIPVRPEDVEVKLFERTDESPEEIFAELDALSGEGPYFMNIKMHDNDFITDESAWVSIYVANKKANRNQLTPPFDLSKAEDRNLLSTPEAEEQWSAYEACVKYASEHTDEYTFWNMIELKEKL